MRNRSVCLSMLAIGAVAWSRAAAPVSGQLLLGFESTLESTIEGVSLAHFDPPLTEFAFTPIGVTEGASALEVTHPGSWVNDIQLAGGLPLAELAAQNNFLVFDVTTSDVGEAGDGNHPSWRQLFAIFNGSSGGWQQNQIDFVVAGDDGSSFTETVFLDLDVTGISANAADAVANWSDEGSYWELFLVFQGGDLGVTPGDYNADTQRGAADYTVWRDNLGGDTLTNETVTLGIVDQADYDEWKSNYGPAGIKTILDNIRFASAGSGSVLATSAAVPEPASLLLAVAAACAAAAGSATRRD